MSEKIIFTEKEVDEIRNLYLNQNWKIKDLSKKFKCSYPVISRTLKENKIEKYPYKVNYDLIIKDFESGMSLTQIEKKYSYNRQSISIILKRMGYNIVNEWNRIKFNNLVFDSIDTEEKAYWLGFIFADGYISKHNKGQKPRYAFELCVKGGDDNHMVKFNNFMGYEGVNIYRGKVSLNGKTFPRSRFCVNNKHLWETLNSYGCTPQKSLTLKFPDINIFSSKDLIRHFIRGYFDGDGYLSYRKKNKLYPAVGFIGTKEMLESIIKYTNIPASSIRKDKRHQHNTYSLIYKLEDSLSLINYMYNDSTIYLDRKYYRYQFFKNGCRSLEEFDELLSGKIEELCDENIEVNS